MNILLTGASSFTGAAFAEALVGAGHRVVAPLRGAEGDYAGLRATRVRRVAAVTQVEWSSPFGSERFLDLCRKGEFALLCHHAAHVGDYRSPDYDVVAALSHNVAGLRSSLEVLKARGLAGVVLTGTVFEANEGAGERPLRAFSGYGLSKTLTAEVFRYWCDTFALGLGKFVIPNPFGPFEEARFCAYLHRTWKAGQVARVNTPDYTRDNIAVDLLAECYRRFCETVRAASGAKLHCAPSGFVESQGAFSRRIARELSPRLGLDCELEFAMQTDRSEPMTRINLDRATELVPDWGESRFWDDYARYLAHS